MDFQHFDLKTAIVAVGYIGLFAIVFAENGLFLGFFLPGDSLLFTAGFLASQGFFDLPTLLVVLLVAALSGVSVGYWFGLKFGRRLFQREDSIWFHRKHLVTANKFYEEHGGKAVILARFLPIVRTFVPIVAGMALMNHTRFQLFNLVGGFAWIMLLTVGGYFVGGLIPGAERYLEPIIALIIVISVLPTALHVYKENREQIHATLGSWAHKKGGRGPGA